VRHLEKVITGGEYLEGDGHRDVTFLPLFVRTALAPMSAENNHYVGSGPDFGMALDGIPQMIHSQIDIDHLVQHRAAIAIQDDDPLALLAVVGHRLTIVVGVLDRANRRHRGQHTHVLFSSHGRNCDRLPRPFQNRNSWWRNMRGFKGPRYLATISSSL